MPDQPIRAYEHAMFEDVMVGKPPPLRVEFALIEIDKIMLDPSNPRLRYRQQIDSTPAIEALFEAQDTKHLREDIRQNGLFERPFVRRGADGKFIMFEGNRRAACYMLLHKENPADPQWQAMPVRILPDDVSEQQLASILGQLHVAGKLKWNPHEQAGHIFHMTEVLKMPDEAVKTILHMGKPAIEKSVAAYRMMMEKFIVIDNGRYKNDGERKFSYFHEFQKVKALRDLAKGDPFFVDDFCRWVGEERLQRAAEDTRQLPAILADEVAKRAFIQTADPKNAFRIASETLANNDATRKSNFFKKLKEAIDAGRKATLTDFNTASQSSGRQLMQDARAMLDLVQRHADNSQSLKL